MEIVNGTDSQLQHSEKTEVEQKHEPLDDGSEPSGDSTVPSFDSSQTSEGSGKLSSDGSGQSSNNSRPSGNCSSSQPTSEISELQLSESEYSSAESVQQVQPQQTVILLNQARNTNIANTEECRINRPTSTGQQMPEVLDNICQQLDSSVKGFNDCGRLPTESLNNNNVILETACDVSKQTLESSVEESKFGGGSNPSSSSGSTKSRSLNLARKSLYSNLSGCLQNTHNQDLTGSTSLNQVDDNINISFNQNNSKTSSQVGENINASINQDNCTTSIDEFAENINNSALGKRSNDPKLGPKLHGSESVSSLEKGQPCPCVYVIIVIISVVIGLGVHYSSQYTPSRNESSLDKFSTHVREIKQKFPRQDHKFWKTFEASTRRILKNDVSKYPAVVLMASSQKHASVALCLARNISSAFDLSIGLSSHSSLIDLKDYKHLDAAEQKIHLDNALNSALRTDKRKSFVLENLQFLDPLAAVLFYSYCDNDYAPFKDVLIILTLYFDDGKEKIYDSEAVEDYLERIWNKGLDTDKVKPLLSRVANHIVIVQGEGPEILDDRCL